MPIFQHNVFLHRKWENGRKSDLRPPVCTNHSVCALHWCTLQKVWFHSYWKSCFRSFQKGLLPASYSKSWLFLDVFSLKRSTFLPSWAGQHQGLSRRPSFPVAGSFSQWEPRHSLCVVHNGLATHTPEPSTDSQVSHCSIHFCQIVPYMIFRLCYFLSFSTLFCLIVSPFVRWVLLPKMRTISTEVLCEGALDVSGQDFILLLLLRQFDSIKNYQYYQQLKFIFYIDKAPLNCK